MREADYIVDIGPGAGEAWRRSGCNGNCRRNHANEKSVTGAYLSGKSRSRFRRQGEPTGWLKVLGAQENNLKNIDVQLPAWRNDLCNRSVGIGKKFTGQSDTLQASGKRPKPCKYHSRKHKGMKDWNS